MAFTKEIPMDLRMQMVFLFDEKTAKRIRALPGEIYKPNAPNHFTKLIERAVAQIMGRLH